VHLAPSQSHRLQSKLLRGVLSRRQRLISLLLRNHDSAATTSAINTHLGGQQQRTECAVTTRHRESHQLSFSKSLCLRALRLTSSPHKGQYKMSTGAERSHERRGTSATTSCARAALIDSSRAAYTPHQRRKLRLIYSNHHHPTHPEVQRS
jgi:hypothetical protein